MKFNSVRFKITILFTVVLGLILAIYSTLLYWNLSHVVYLEVDKNLREKVLEFENVLNDYAGMLDQDAESIPFAIKRAFHIDEIEAAEVLQWPKVKTRDQLWKHNMQTLGIKSDFVVAYDAVGRLVDHSINMEEGVIDLLNRQREGLGAITSPVIRNIFTKDVKLRAIVMPYYRKGRVQYILQLATSLEPVLFVLKSKMHLIIVTIPIVLVFSSFFGAFFVWRILKPVREITKTAESITLEDMSRRVTSKHADEEIASLVQAFNHMLGRLETSIKYIEQFSSDVAHELKTPLAIIRGESEVALRRPRSADEYRRTLEVVIEEIQRMLKIIEDLMLLTKLDYRMGTFKLEELELVDFMKELHEQVGIVASEKGVQVTLNAVEGPLAINGHRLHLRRLFFNLVENSLKFTPSGGRIDLRLGREGGKAVLSVTDTGSGIDPKDLPRIFDRFFSADRRGKTADAASSGLGLSIVMSVARMHNGSVDVSSVPGQGTTFLIRLPLMTKN